MSFFSTSQAKCLFDFDQTDPTLDHGAEMILPGERFDADQQCKSHFFIAKVVNIHRCTFNSIPLCDLVQVC